MEGGKYLLVYLIRRARRHPRCPLRADNGVDCVGFDFIRLLGGGEMFEWVINEVCLIFLLCALVFCYVFPPSREQCTLVQMIGCTGVDPVLPSISWFTSDMWCDFPKN